jgi:hydroxymethylglutaryl-CoA reductase (NADPH)
VSEDTRIPRDPDNDYSEAIVAERLKLAESRAGKALPHLGGRPVDAEQARGKVENFTGWARVPLGLAGPLHVETASGPCEVLVPMATTEGALVASYSRGMRLARESAAIRSRVVREGLTQNPILVYADAAGAQRGLEFTLGALDELRTRVAGTTQHGSLDSVEGTVVGRRLLLSLRFLTGDAIGINMAARATDLCAAWLEEQTGARSRYVHGQDVEKRANARALVEGRGRSVVADVTVPRDVLARVARVAPQDLLEIWKSYTVGYAQLGTQNWTVQAANGLAAVFLACGQDLAYVTESATGHLDLDVTEGGDLYASVTLPSLLVGTVGGGSGQGTARECLELLGCFGASRANHFAEILGATILAGDLSLMASFCSHEFVAAHEKLGRNRPEVR